MYDSCDVTNERNIMAMQIYIREEIKEKLERLCKLDHRSMVDELSFLIDTRMSQIGPKTAQDASESQNSVSSDANPV